MLCNITRARDFMRRYKLDAIIATSPVCITYLSDYACWIDHLSKTYMSVPGGSSDSIQNYALFSLEGDPCVIVSPLFAVNAASAWGHDVATYGEAGLDVTLTSTEVLATDPFFHMLERARFHRTSHDALVDLINAHGLSDARIGLEMERLAAPAAAAIEAGLPRAEIKDCTNLLRMIRMVKSHEELERLARAAAINEQAASDSLARARAGITTAEITQTYREIVAAFGADFDHFAIGLRGRGIVTDGGYILKHGDILYTDFGCTFQHYYSDSGRTLALGELPTELATRQAALEASIAAGVHMLRPQVKASTVQASMAAALHEQLPIGAFPHGHSLGLEIREYPILVAENGLHIRDGYLDHPSDLPLEADMVLNLEAALFMPDVGSLQVEQSFVVTDDGCRLLAGQDGRAPVVSSCSTI